MILSPEETVHFELEEDLFDMDYPEKSKYGWAYNRIPLTRRQWLYLIIGQCIGPGIVNFFINTMEIMWKMAANRNLAFYIKHGEVLVFMLASGILMYFFQQEPDSLRSNMNGLFKFFIGQN
eukprot:gene3886-4495_t